MKVLSRQAMQQVDHQALATYGLPTLALMENAGRWVAQRAGALLGDAHGRRVVVVCGGGNNGGDALVAARHLHNWGARVWAVMAVEGWPSNPRLSELAATQLEVVRRLGVEVLGLQEEGRRRLDLVLEAADLVVDGVLGTGTRGAPRGAALEAVRWMQQARAPVLAVDIPSGVDTDTGQVPGPAVAAVETVTFGLPKPAHVLYPAAGLCGRVWVADIGFPRALLDEAPAAFEVLEE
ncbi:MAG TPA: NAD(P)H-hydrate epimerase, partial [Limnochordales bacterium]